MASRDWAATARASMDGDDEATALTVIRDAIIDSVEDHLDWNVRAYGKAWTGEGEDTNFICGEAPDAVIERLRECGFEVVRIRG